MSARQFNAAEIAALKNNPNIAAVYPEKILYSARFKEHAIASYFAGQSPKEIFEEAGFDVELLGYKRIERALSRWSATASIDRLPAAVSLCTNNPDTLKKLVTSQERRIAKLQREVACLMAQPEQAQTPPKSTQSLTAVCEMKQRKKSLCTHREKESSTHAKKAR